MKGRDLLVILFGGLIFAGILFRFFPQKKPTTKTAIVSPVGKGIKGISTFISHARGNKLDEVVTTSLAGTHGTYGIVIKNLRTGETYYQNENMTFETASLYKLWVMAAVYQQYKNGTLTPDQTLSESVEDLNKAFDIDPDYAEKTDGDITFTVNDALEQMITISDNYAALLLTAKIRLSTVANFLTQQGFKHSIVGEPPRSTPNDIALFYEKLYAGTIVDGDSSKQMIELLDHQAINDRIPKYLPDNIQVAHKTGELDEYKHDAGIIFAKDPILFVAMSKSDSPPDAAERIAQLASDVYDYFNTKSD
ncbi:MAG TPA: serine hydrolase [Patescibacteria group bacterium]|nr:serine hydrolase [Patescibacteria group bacterium]